jgi:hypothetical protein
VTAKTNTAPTIQTVSSRGEKIESLFMPPHSRAGRAQSR